MEDMVILLILPFMLRLLNLYSSDTSSISRHYIPRRRIQTYFVVPCTSLSITFVPFDSSLLQGGYGVYSCSLFFAFVFLISFHAQPFSFIFLICSTAWIFSRLTCIVTPNSLFILFTTRSISRIDICWASRPSSCLVEERKRERTRGWNAQFGKYGAGK